MAAQHGSMRYWLQRAVTIKLAHAVYPFNSNWKYVGKRHERSTKALIKELREIADGLEKRGHLK